MKVEGCGFRKDGVVATGGSEPEEELGAFRQVHVAELEPHHRTDGPRYKGCCAVVTRPTLHHRWTGSSHAGQNSPTAFQDRPMARSHTQSPPSRLLVLVLLTPARAGPKLLPTAVPKPELLFLGARHQWKRIDLPSNIFPPRWI